MTVRLLAGAQNDLGLAICVSRALYFAHYISRRLYTVRRLTRSRWVITVIFYPSFSHSRA